MSVASAKPAPTKTAPAKTPALLRLYSENADGEAKGVEIFGTGIHRDKIYTTADLDQMAANFGKLSSGEKPVVRPPLVAGHEEDTDQLLNNSGWPAAGWPTKVYRQGDKLLADYNQIPRPIARMINNKAYRKVSAEIYDDFENDGQHYGKTLRRVALLGGEIPQVKTLADFPKVGYAEQPRDKPNFLRFFSEVPAMNRDEVIQQLTTKGYDPAMLAGLEDAELAEMLRVESDETAGPDGMSDKTKAAFAANCKTMSAKYRERGTKFGATFDDGTDTGTPAPGAAMGEPPAVTPPPSVANHATPPAPAAHPPAPAAAIPADHPSEVVMHYTELEAKNKALEAKQKALEAKQQQLEKFAEERIAAEKRARIDSEVKALVHSGQILPSELDAGKYDYLYDLPATGNVSKYTEGGKAKTGSPLDAALAKIKAGPVLVRFGEKLKDPHKAAAAGDVEVNKVQRFAESDQAFQHALSVQGKTPDDFVNEFKKVQAKNPKVTAAMYGVPA